MKLAQRLDRLEARYGDDDDELVEVGATEPVKAHVRTLLAARGMPPEQIERELEPEPVPRRHVWSEVPTTLCERIRAAAGDDHEETS